MLNAEYFRARFKGAAKKDGPRVRTELYLHSGAMFEVEEVDSIEDGYVVFSVYPPTDADAAAKRDRGDAPAPNSAGATDRVVVAYESISCLHFAPAVRQPGRSVGF